MLSRLLVVAGALLLTGCFTGGPFYGAQDSRIFVTPGFYELTAPDLEYDLDEPPEDGRVRVVIDSRGFTNLLSYQGSGRPWVLGFAPLPGTDRVHLFWTVEEEDGGGAGDGTMYGIAAADGEGGYRLSLALCPDGDPPAGALRFGLFICHFSDRAALEAALLAEVPRLSQGMRLLPLTAAQ